MELKLGLLTWAWLPHFQLSYHWIAQGTKLRRDSVIYISNLRNLKTKYCINTLPCKSFLALATFWENKVCHRSIAICADGAELKRED